MNVKRTHNLAIVRTLQKKILFAIYMLGAKYGLCNMWIALCKARGFALCTTINGLPANTCAVQSAKHGFVQSMKCVATVVFARRCIRRQSNAINVLATKEYCQSHR